MSKPKRYWMMKSEPDAFGIDDLEREYPAALLQRCILYHYASAGDGRALASRGYRVALPGEVVALQETTAARIPSP